MTQTWYMLGAPEAPWEFSGAGTGDFLEGGGPKCRLQRLFPARANRRKAQTPPPQKPSVIQSLNPKSRFERAATAEGTMNRGQLLVSILALQAFISAAPKARCETQEIFRIGDKDRSFTEFARVREPGRPVAYRIGQSSPAKDWFAYQPGSFDYKVARSTENVDWVSFSPGSRKDLAKDQQPIPYQIIFSLPALPKGKFILRLDAIFRYRRPAAPRFEISINGNIGTYQLDPRAAPELWWPTGGDEAGGLQFIGYESSEMVLPASYFRRGDNTLTMRYLDGFGIYYDALTLANDPSSTVPLVIAAWVQPTVFYKNRGSGVVELGQVRVRSSRPIRRATLKILIGGTQVTKEIQQSQFGDVEATIEVPASDHPLPVTLRIQGVKAPVFKETFVPRRRWKVYALPMEQADFGYNEVPSRTLEWENRYIDKVLELLPQFPSYSFTLDASANLESFLSTRDAASAKTLLDHLRSGRMGINALYDNFFTGLATPEELFHRLEYALLAGREHGFPVDSASQTDEPSVAWALAQILAEAGIKYFSIGSDPVRGALNPIGLLNFRSPFYWEAPNGAKVLVWSGVSYTGVDDMTWGGWNEEAVRAGKYSPSLLGLERSLPLFLSQYERDDHPFDAVLLYGLHNDEIPIRHFGSADIIEGWNREYAYPKVIPATQQEFFRYVIEHSGSEIRTLRGDGGAYWEDEAGADARIAALNRTSQMQVLAAEKFESIANWLKPLLRFDHAPFLDAWRNLILTDCYVWSDANSYSRPYSYRTRFGEAAHRAWAEAAFQQTWDLRLVAMDKIAELVETNALGAVVFNAESWPRGGFFDFELEPDEMLVDPATAQAIPCGSLKSLNGYQEVRCWAAEVPATGYKFFAIGKGRVPEGEVIHLDRSAPTVEGKYYRLQLDPQSGAVVHLIDNSTGQDLVNSGSPYRMNEYLYVTGGDPGDFIPGSINDNRLLSADATLPVPELTVNRQALVGAPQAQRFPWGTVITVRAKATNTPEIVSTITLNDESKLVTFHNEVEKVATMKKEGIYFAFPFAAQQPQVKFQGAAAWLDPEADMLPGANRQWFTTQGGVWVKGANGSVAWATVDAPLITLEDINRGLWPDSIQVRNGAVFSYAMNNYWFTDTPAQQGGRFAFRYALTSASDVSLAQAARVASEQRSSLTAIRHYHKEWKQTLPVTGAGFLNASPPGVTVLTIRPLAGENAYLVRVHNSTPQELNATLHFPMTRLEDAYLGSVLGERNGAVDWEPNSIKLPLNRYDIKSLVVRVKGSEE
jgi:alpha-mannosidase